VFGDERERVVEIAMVIEQPQSREQLKEQPKEQQPNNYRTPQSKIIRPAPLSLDNKYLKILLLSEPGDGKTHQITTLPEWMYPVALLDIDNKAVTMPLLIPFIKDGRIDIYPIDAAIIDSQETLIGRASNDTTFPKELPRGLLQVIDIVNYITGRTKAAREDKDRKIYKTIFYDSGSHLADHVERTTQFIQKCGSLKGAGAYGEGWDKFKSLMDDFMGPCVKSINMHVMMSCHVMWKIKKKEKDGSEIGAWEPLITGQFKHKIISYFNEAYFLMAKWGVGDKRIYKMIVNKTSKYPARTNIRLDRRVRNEKGEEIEEGVIMEADVGKMAKRWREQMEGK